MDPHAPPLFYAFAFATVAAALAVIAPRNPVHAVLFLVLTFFTVACMWILVDAEFLALALVMVYVGAVMVLFLFVVMMLDIDLVARGLRAVPAGRPDGRGGDAGRDARPDRRPQPQRGAVRGQRRARRRHRWQHRMAGAGAVHRLPAAVRDGRADPYRGHRGSGRADSR